MAKGGKGVTLTAGAQGEWVWHLGKGRMGYSIEGIKGEEKEKHQAL